MSDVRNHAVWLGPLVVFLGAVSYFTAFVRFPALRDFPWVNLPLVALGVGISLLGARRAFRLPRSRGRRILGACGLTFSALVGGLFGFYVFYLSYSLPPASDLTLSLEAAPEFRLTDHEGRPVALEDYRGRKLILSFYRGHW